MLHYIADWHWIWGWNWTVSKKESSICGAHGGRDWPLIENSLCCLAGSYCSSPAGRGAGWWGAWGGGEPGRWPWCCGSPCRRRRSRSPPCRWGAGGSCSPPPARHTSGSSNCLENTPHMYNTMHTEEGKGQKKRQRSLLLFGGQKLCNSLPR